MVFPCYLPWRFPPVLQISFSVLEHTPRLSPRKFRARRLIGSMVMRWNRGGRQAASTISRILSWMMFIYLVKKSKPSPGQKICHPYVHQGRKTTPQKSNYSNTKVDATFPPYCFIFKFKTTCWQSVPSTLTSRSLYIYIYLSQLYWFFPKIIMLEILGNPSSNHIKSSSWPCLKASNKTPTTPVSGFPPGTLSPPPPRRPLRVLGLRGLEQIPGGSEVERR